MNTNWRFYKLNILTIFAALIKILAYGLQRRSFNRTSVEKLHSQTSHVWGEHKITVQRHFLSFNRSRSLFSRKSKTQRRNFKTTYFLYKEKGWTRSQPLPKSPFYQSSFISESSDAQSSAKGCRYYWWWNYCWRTWQTKCATIWKVCGYWDLTTIFAMSWTVMLSLKRFSFTWILTCD